MKGEPLLLSRSCSHYHEHILTPTKTSCDTVTTLKVTPLLVIFIETSSSNIAWTYFPQARSCTLPDCKTQLMRQRQDYINQIRWQPTRLTAGKQNYCHLSNTRRCDTVDMVSVDSNGSNSHKCKPELVVYNINNFFLSLNTTCLVKYIRIWLTFNVYHRNNIFDALEKWVQHRLHNISIELEMRIQVFRKIFISY